MLKDKRSDLAVLRIKDAHERFPTLQFANSDALEVGDVVLAPIGFPKHPPAGPFNANSRPD